MSTNADGDATAQRVAEEAGGSPLLLSELARFAVTHAESPQAISLQELVAHRIGHLPEGARPVLYLVACSARRVTGATLQRATGLDTATLRAHLDRLRDERLVGMPLESPGADGGTEMLHDKLRVAVRENLSAEQLAQYHAKLALALEQGGTEDLESIAHHHEAAGNSQRAQRWLEAAALHATTSLAFERAVSLYERACTHGTPQGTLPLRRKLADALVHAGRGPEAARLFLELAKEAESEAEGRSLRRHAAEQYIRAGYVEEALEEFRPLLHEAGLAFPRTPASALTSLLWNRMRLKLRGTDFAERAEHEIPERELARIDYCWVLTTGLAGIDLVRSAHYHSVSFLLALQAGEPARIARAHALHAVMKALEHTSGLPSADEHAAIAQELSQRIRNSHARGWAVASKCIIAFGRVELARTVEFADEATALLRERSESTFREIGSLEVWFALHALFLSGRLAEFAERAPACAREAEARGDRYTLSTVRAYALALHWAVLDRPEQARLEADAAIQSWPEGAFYHQHWARLRAHCLLDLYEGNGPLARQRIAELRPRMKSAMMLRIRTPRVEFNYLEARGALEAWRKGKSSSAHAGLIKKRIGELRQESYGLADAYAEALEAGIAALSDAAAGAQGFLAAARAFEALGTPLHHAACEFRSRECARDLEGMARATAKLASHGVINPLRFIDMLAPRVA